VQHGQGNSLPNAAIVGIHLMDISGEHESGHPGVSILLGVCEHVPDVIFLNVDDGTTNVSQSNRGISPVVD